MVSLTELIAIGAVALAVLGLVIVGFIAVVSRRNDDER